MPFEATSDEFTRLLSQPAAVAPVFSGLAWTWATREVVGPCARESCRKWLAEAEIPIFGALAM